MHSTFQVFCSFELHIFNYFACTIYTSNILAVKLTVHIATLLMHLLPVSESGWISTSSRATIVDSCITFTVCWTATSSNITLHVGSDTVGCTRVVVNTRLKTFFKYTKRNRWVKYVDQEPILDKSLHGFVSLCQ